MVTAPIYPYHPMVPCHVWQPWVPHVTRVRLLELYGLAGAGVLPTVNLGIDRKGQPKAKTVNKKEHAHAKRKVATALSMKVKPV